MKQIIEFDLPISLNMYYSFHHIEYKIRRERWWW